MRLYWSTYTKRHLPTFEALSVCRAYHTTLTLYVFASVKNVFSSQYFYTRHIKYTYFLVDNFPSFKKNVYCIYGDRDATSDDGYLNTPVRAFFTTPNGIGRPVTLLSFRTFPLLSQRNVLKN